MAAPKWLSPAEMKAWLGFITTSADLIRAIEKDLEPFGLDGGDYQLLAMLSDAPLQRMKMCELADVLRLSRSGLTRRMDGVLQAKYVVRVRDERDGRSVFAQLTAKGFELLKKAAPDHLKSVRLLMIDLLSEAEVKALGTAFAKINTSLQAK
jgi:DNA-binding MarR family transcriptional regulator